ncbi:MAG: M48 family metalloprotease [Sphingomonadaceae bacterium]|nr:M48 family metalloprotease [Sphingomonadaceae bacterium]
MLLLVFALVAAGAPDAGLDALRAADLRVATIGWRLQTANVALCRDVVALPGFTVQTLSQYPPGTRAAARQVLGLGGRPAVGVIVPGSPADRIGLQAGDTIAAIDGAPTSDAVAPRASYESTAKVEADVEAALAHAPAKIVVERSGARRTFALAGDKGCASRVQIVPGGKLDASADGRYVEISGGLYDFAANDDELAVAIAHELAHNILGHRARLDSEGVSRGLFAGFGKSGAALRATEFEADRLGVWLVARAGYDVDAIVPFWTRIGAKTGAGILSDGTHPRWKDRIARAAAAVAELKAQRTAGWPLIPSAQQSSSQAR